LTIGVDLKQRRRGILIVALGVVVLSTEGLVIRSVTVDQWTLLQWRGGLMFAALAAYLAISSRGEFRERMFGLGAPGLLAALLFASDNVLFNVSILRTDVANTLFMISSAPVFAALFSAVFLRERVSRRTLVLIAVALVAVAIILTADFGGSALVGNLAGLGAAMSIAGTFVVLRGGRAKNMLASMAWGAFLGALVATPFAHPLSPTAKDAALLILLGGVISPLAFGLLGTGPRYLPAAEVSLMILVEAVLAPVWVWLVLSESPSSRVVVGGILLLGSLAVYYGADIVRQRQVSETVSTI
jgi:drug/metabolite transporter (DMT)-like permease